MSARLPPERMPVIVGVGEITDRAPDPSQGLEPIALMEQALRRAEEDAGAALLARIDALDVVNQVTWPYADMPGQLAARIRARPAHAFYGPVGGESPVRFCTRQRRVSRRARAILPRFVVRRRRAR